MATSIEISLAGRIHPYQAERAQHVEFSNYMIAQVHGGIGHGRDFGFATTRDKLAQRVSDLCADLSDGDYSFVVDLDADGDITVKDVEQKVSLLVSNDTISLLASVVPVASLLDEHAKVLTAVSLAHSIFASRGVSRWEGMGVLVKFAVPYKDLVAEGHALSRARAEYFAGFDRISEAILPDASAAELILGRLAGKTGGLVHELTVTSEKANNAIQFDLDTKTTRRDFTGDYREFAQRALKLATDKLPAIASPILADPEIDTDFLVRGTRRGTL